MLNGAETMIKRTRFIVIAILLPLVVLAAVSIPYVYDSDVWANNENSVLISGHSSQYGLGTYLLAEFTNDIRALFYHQSTTGSYQWRQVGPGWGTTEPPTDQACDADAQVTTGCAPIAIVYPEFAGCDFPDALYDFEFNVPPKFKPASNYVLEREKPYLIFWTEWVEIYNDSDERVLITVPKITNFRSTGENEWGRGSWTNFSVHNPCGDNDPGDPPIHIDSVSISFPEQAGELETSHSNEQ